MELMTWTPERIAEVERLWNEGLTTSEIGRRIGVSKNAVVGKVHRLGLPSRESPIQRKPTTIVEVKGPTCLWPIGDPDEPNFHFCGKAAVASRPYCAEHCAVAYISSVPKRDGRKPAKAA